MAKIKENAQFANQGEIYLMANVHLEIQLSFAMIQIVNSVLINIRETVKFVSQGILY